jgi:signal transduction histidine kinase
VHSNGLEAWLAAHPQAGPDVVVALARCYVAESVATLDAIVLAHAWSDDGVAGLRALDRDEVRDLITEISGVVPWKDKAAAIHEATAGNPLFVREVTRLLVSADRLDRPGPLSIPVPGSVRTVIRQRLTPLSADAVQVLSAAAVVGRDFDLVLVAAASDLPMERVLGSLCEAVTLGVVTEADSAGVYRFTHPLMRAAIYEGLPLAARTEMHHRVADAIERVGGDESPSRLGELAYHFAQVAALGESAKACEYARRAGDHAMDTFAYEDGIVQYRRALDALVLAKRSDPLVRCELLLRLGQAQARAGEYQDAKATFLLAADTARKLGKAEHLARAALGMGEQLIEAGRLDRQLLSLLEEAIERLGPDDSAFRVRLQARLSLELTFADETRGKPRREALSLEAIQIARRLDDPSARVDALRARWMALWGPDGLTERSALTEEILAIAHETGDRATELIGLMEGTDTTDPESPEARAGFAQELARQGVEVRLALTSEPVPVHMDANRLRQILLNLLRNAEQALEDKPADAEKWIEVAVTRRNHQPIVSGRRNEIKTPPVVSPERGALETAQEVAAKQTW